MPRRAQTKSRLTWQGPLALLKRHAETTGLAFGWVLVALSGAAAATCLAKSGLGPDTAAWIQAAGSIAAINSAFWLSRSDARNRRREKRWQGEEIAWGVRFALSHARVEVQTIVRELVDGSVAAEDPSRHWRLRIANAASVLRTFAERTDHIHPALNHIASNGRLLLQQFEESLQPAMHSLGHGERPSMRQAEAVAWFEINFQELIDLLDARMRGVSLHLDATDQNPEQTRFELWKVDKAGLAPEGEKASD
jgi:hypothetical protein